VCSEWGIKVFNAGYFVFDSFKRPINRMSANTTKATPTKTGTSKFPIITQKGKTMRERCMRLAMPKNANVSFVNGFMIYFYKNLMFANLINLIFKILSKMLNSHFNNKDILVNFKY
jgi:hypothetical protein